MEFSPHKLVLLACQFPLLEEVLPVLLSGNLSFVSSQQFLDVFCFFLSPHDASNNLEFLIQKPTATKMFGFGPLELFLFYFTRVFVCLFVCFDITV